MSYQVRFTDTTKTPITVEDQTINSEKSVTFVGKNYPGYAQYIAENFLHLLENFAKTTEPTNPITGQVWFNTTVGIENGLKVYNGTNWVSSGHVKKSIARPTTGVVGDLWVDTTNQQLHLYNGTSWVLVGPNSVDGQATAALLDRIVDTSDIERPVLTLLVNGETVVIISEKDFTPKAALAGFTTIKQGINISTKNFNSSSGGNKLWGTAEKADALVIGSAAIAATNFLRKDEASVTNFQLSVRNNTGVSIGGDLSLSISIENNAAVISNKISGSSIDFKVKGTSNDPIVRIDSSTNVGFNKTNPGETVDVHGNIRTDGQLKITGTDDATSLITGSITTAGGASIAKLLRVGTGLNVTGASTLDNVLPKTDSAFDLGSNGTRWRTLYADSVTTDNLAVTNTISGSINGNATTANNLVSSIQLSLAGDVVTGSPVTICGVGDTTNAVLNVSIAGSFIATKVSATDSFITDELLINRSGSLRRITKEKFVSNIATVPAGAILPYAGTTIPTGYLLCDGSEVLIANYPALFAAIQYNYKSISLLTGVGTFALPDLRGRFALGKDDMGGTSANRVTDVAADTIGGQGGAEEVILDRSNLPQHVHNLKGDAGSQYYAFAQRTGTPPDSNAEPANGLTAVGQGQLMVDSGGIYTDDLPTSTLSVPFNITNHYLAINYIIFTGRIS